jgi:hypothetical protein
MKNKVISIPNRAWQLIRAAYRTQYPSGGPGLSAWLRQAVQAHCMAWTGLSWHEQKPGWRKDVDPTLDDSCVIYQACPQNTATCHNKEELETLL